MKKNQKQLEEFTRSSTSMAVTLADGTKAQLAHQLKRGIPQMYWYYLQWPCGGWREFDVRWLYQEAQEEEVATELDAIMLSTDPAIRCTILAAIGERVATFSFDRIKAASF